MPEQNSRHLEAVFMPSFFTAQRYNFLLPSENSEKPILESTFGVFRPSFVRVQPVIFWNGS